MWSSSSVMASGWGDTDLWINVWLLPAGISAHGVGISLGAEERLPTPLSDASFPYKLHTLKYVGQFYSQFG